MIVSAELSNRNNDLTIDRIINFKSVVNKCLKYFVNCKWHQQSSSSNNKCYTNMEWC